MQVVQVVQVVHAGCCGLDVHQKTVVACVLLTHVLLTQTSGQVRREVRVFGTMTVDLLALNEWLNDLNVRQVAMESTGVLWRAVACCGVPCITSWRPITTSS
jgi:hypothetical protein